MAIITITFIVDLMVQFQFSAMAKAAFTDKKDLTAFLGSFYGVYLNLASFAMQFFLTAMIVRYLGVGGTLQVMPVVIGIAAAVTAFVPRLARRRGDASFRSRHPLFLQPHRDRASLPAAAHRTEEPHQGIRRYLHGPLRPRPGRARFSWFTRRCWKQIPSIPT